MWLQLMTFIAFGLTYAIDDLEYMEDTDAVFIDSSNTKETTLLKEMLGRPIGDVDSVTPVKQGVSKKSKMKINCHHVNPDTSRNRKKLLFQLCPGYREKEFAKTSYKVADVIQKPKSKTYKEQRKEFVEAVTEMAHAAGHLPTLELH